jgi:ubiquinol-cytochrome c reductase cytochrome b subunit
MNLTGRAQQLWAENMSLEDALPTKMPVYVDSMAYLFGAAALSSLVMLVLSGLTLATFGPTWYHSSEAGHFVNSIHFWGVQVFFGTVVAHAMTKLFQAAWRDRRWWTWAAGLAIFAVTVEGQRQAARFGSPLDRGHAVLPTN